MSLKEKSNGDIERQISMPSDEDNTDGSVEPRQDDSSPDKLYPNQFNLPNRLRRNPYQVVARPLPQEMPQRLTITDKCVQKWKKNTGIVIEKSFQKYAHIKISINSVAQFTRTVISVLFLAIRPKSLNMNLLIQLIT